MLKSTQPIRIATKIPRKKFESDAPAEDRVAGEIDFTHPTFAYLFNNFIVFYSLAGLKLVGFVQQRFRSAFNRWYFHETRGVLI